MQTGKKKVGKISQLNKIGQEKTITRNRNRMPVTGSVKEDKK